MSSHQNPGGESGFIYKRAAPGQTAELTGAQAYNALRAKTAVMLHSPNEAQKGNIERLNSDLLHLREVSPGAVQTSTFLSTMSVQYANDMYIGEALMPVMPVPNQAGSYPTYDKRDHLNVPDDSISPRGDANEMSDGRGTDTYATVGKALSNMLLVETLRNQQAPLDEMVDLMSLPADGMALRRDIRIADVLTTAANYPTGNKITLSAGNRWSDVAGTPRQDILAAIGALWQGNGMTKLKAWMSLDVWNVLRIHSDLLGLLGANDRGMVSAKTFCEFFDLDELLVSQTRKDTANRAQAAAYSRVYGNNFGVCRVAPRPGVRNAFFGATLRWDGMTVQQWFDPKTGTKGAYWAKVATHEVQKIVAADTAYLITTPI
jgi:hypothetical protein